MDHVSPKKEQCRVPNSSEQKRHYSKAGTARDTADSSSVRHEAGMKVVVAVVAVSLGGFVSVDVYVDVVRVWVVRVGLCITLHS